MESAATDSGSLSNSSKRILISRFKIHKRFNGFCLGRLLCVDNLGHNFDRERLCAQIQELVSGVVEIRFAGVTLDGKRHDWGWCCIEFSTADAAVAAMEVLDATYLKTGDGGSFLRPLLPHFPISLDQLDFSITHSSDDSDPVALHLGQPTSVNIESKEFVRLNGILEQIKQTLLEKGEKALGPVLRRLVPPGNGHDGQRKQTESTSQTSKRLLLSDVPARVTNEMLFTFFEFHDSDVDIVRVLDPVTQQNSSHVIVGLSNEEKARLICYDIDRHMLLSDCFRPISARLFDTSCVKGFESLFDRCLSEIGVNLATCSPSGDLVQIKDAGTPEERIAKEARVVLESVQHSRHHNSRLKRKHQLALHNHIMTKVDKTQKRFDQLVSSISTAEKLVEKEKASIPTNDGNN